MKKFHVFIIKIKNHTLPAIFLIFTICLVIFSNSNLSAVQNGLSLWATSVVPSLLPFFIATELLLKTDIPYILGKIFNIFMKPLFNIRGEGSFCFIMGIISGYPVGAKIASNFRKENILSKSECERLLSFTNNSGPLFIIGTVGISMFGSSTIGFLLFITHILACITVGIIFRFWKSNSDIQNQKSTNFGTSMSFDNFSNSHVKKREHSSSNNFKNTNTVTFSNLGGVIAESITSAFSTIIMIGGFVVLFSVIISILQASHLLELLETCIIPLFNLLHIPSSFISPLLTGILEITNGISLISNIQIKAISINIIFTAFLLGIGGISVLLQVLSITSKTDLSIKPYIIGKLLHGTIAAFYTFLFIQYIPMFNFNLL